MAILKPQSIRHSHPGVIHGSLHTLIRVALDLKASSNQRLEAIDTLGSEETPSYVAEMLATLASRNSESADIRLAAINGLRFIRKGSNPYKSLQRLYGKSEKEGPIYNRIEKTLDEIHQRWVTS
jgi:HEAT repeat protein